MEVQVATIHVGLLADQTKAANYVIESVGALILLNIKARLPISNPILPSNIPTTLDLFNKQKKKVLK